MRIDPTPPIGRADRVALGRPATMRDPARAPIDVLIENLSETGALLRAEGATRLPVGSLVSLGIAGLGIQLARVVRTEPRAAAIAFMVPLPSDAVARAKAAPSLDAVAIPQILVERSARDMPAAASTPDRAADDAETPVTRLPVTPLPSPAEPVRTPLVYGAAGTIDPVAVTPAEEARLAPDARALWLPAPSETRPSRPGIAAWLIAGVALLAALVWLLA